MVLSYPADEVSGLCARSPSRPHRISCSYFCQLLPSETSPVPETHINRWLSYAMVWRIVKYSVEWRSFSCYLCHGVLLCRPVALAIPNFYTRMMGSWPFELMFYDSWPCIQHCNLRHLSEVGVGFGTLMALNVVLTFAYTWRIRFLLNLWSMCSKPNAISMAILWYIWCLWFSAFPNTISAIIWRNVSGCILSAWQLFIFDEYGDIFLGNEGFRLKLRAIWMIWKHSRKP